MGSWVRPCDDLMLAPGQLFLRVWFLSLLIHQCSCVPWHGRCVVYFCLAGRPPVWAQTEPQMLQQIVQFDCERSFPHDFPEAAKSLVLGLLDPNPTTRLGGGAAGLAVLQVGALIRACGAPVHWCSHWNRITPSSQAWTYHPYSPSRPPSSKQALQRRTLRLGGRDGKIQ